MALTVILKTHDDSRNDEILKHLCRNGWYRLSDNTKEYIIPIAPVIINGKPREVDNFFRFRVKESTNVVTFISDPLPPKYYMTTAYKIYRKLAGKIVCDLLSTDLLPISEYLIRYTADNS